MTHTWTGVRARVRTHVGARTCLTAAVLLVLSGCGGGGTAAHRSGGSVTATGASADQSAEVDGQDTKVFRPMVVVARVGTLHLTVRNAGQVPHDLTFADPALGHTRTLDGGASQVLTLTLDKPGTYPFVCTFHEHMTGTVVVR